VNSVSVIFRVANYKDIFVHLPPCMTALIGLKIVCVPGLDMELNDVNGEIMMDPSELQADNVFLIDESEIE